jgi:hypothetical protein
MTAKTWPSAAKIRERDLHVQAHTRGRFGEGGEQAFIKRPGDRWRGSIDVAPMLIDDALAFRALMHSLHGRAGEVLVPFKDELGGGETVALSNVVDACALDRDGAQTRYSDCTGYSDGTSYTDDNAALVGTQVAAGATSFQFTLPVGVSDIEPGTLLQIGSPTPQQTVIVTSRELGDDGLRNGAVAGAVVGSPGTSPTNWAINVVAGISSQIVATGSDVFGEPYVDVRFYGVASASGDLSVAFETTTYVVAALGEAWRLTVGLGLVAGSLAGINAGYPRLEVFERTAAGAYVDGSTTAVQIYDEVVRRTLDRTLTGATTERVSTALRLNVSSGLALDVTLRFSRPRLAKNLGKATVAVTPRIRETIAGGTTIKVGQAVGRFRLAEDTPPRVTIGPGGYAEPMTISLEEFV